MSDTRLRELERRWKETGAVEDEAAYLLERVRVGDLTQERLVLAGRLGQPAALIAAHHLSGAMHVPLAGSDDAFGTALRILAQNEQRQFACDCAQRVVRFWGEFAPNDLRPQVAIAVARRHASGEATDAEMERARSEVEAASWCTARNAADAAEAAKAAASREPEFALWAADVGVRVVGRSNAQSLPPPPHAPFRDIAWSTHDAAKHTGARAEREWQRRRLAEYLLGRETHQG